MVADRVMELREEFCQVPGGRSAGRGLAHLPLPGTL